MPLDFGCCADDFRAELVCLLIKWMHRKEFLQQSVRKNDLSIWVALERPALLPFVSFCKARRFRRDSSFPSLPFVYNLRLSGPSSATSAESAVSPLQRFNGSTLQRLEAAKPTFRVTSGRISGCTSVTTTKHAINDSARTGRKDKKYDNSIHKKFDQPAAFAARFTA